MIEDELCSAGTARLEGLGDFLVFQFENSVQPRFRMDAKWAEEINEPKFKAKIGLKRRLKRNKLELVN